MGFLDIEERSYFGGDRKLHEVRLDDGKMVAGPVFEFNGSSWWRVISNDRLRGLEWLEELEDDERQEASGRGFVRRRSCQSRRMRSKWLQVPG
jgi:hypothetical protein